MKTNKRLELWNKLPMEFRPKVRFWLPGAAVEEEDLREEIRLLCERGFGGVEAVVLSTLPEMIARGEDGWGTEHWNEMVSVIADETKKLGMSMDLAIGPGWPIASPVINSIEDPAVLWELTYGTVTTEAGKIYYGPLPERRMVRNEGNPELLHVMAYQEQKDGKLVLNTYQDLRQHINEEQKLIFDFPNGNGEKWRVFAFYQQPAAQKINAGKNYVIDHLSKCGAEACGKYWEEIFKRYSYESMESLFCDSLEYQSALDWTPGLPTEFERQKGYSLLQYLPFLGLSNLYPPCDIPGYQLDNTEISDMVNNDYLDTLTQMYCVNHLDMLEKMAEKYGKTVRYQVAYNKPFEAEQSSLYVAIPENEALGRPAIDCLKSMAAGVHLGHKKRYSFECAAEFGNCYGQNYEDLFWWVKRSLMAGMNAQVLHGASYSGKYHGRYSEDGQLPGTSWPGYEGFGKLVSNYWNRTPSVSDARGCMDAITRMNMVFRQKAKVDCAIFRCSYSNDGTGSEHCIYQDGGLLANQGYSYEFVSEHLLELSVCKVTNRILDKEGIGYKCLIIPEQKMITFSFLQKIKELTEAGLPVIWVGKKPKSAMFFSEWNTAEKRACWNACIEDVWKKSDIVHVESLTEVPETLRRLEVLPEFALDGNMNLMTAVREDSLIRYFILYGYNCVEFSPSEQNPDELAVSALYRKGTTKGTYIRPGKISRKKVRVRLKGKGDVFLCNPWNGEKERQSFTENCEGYMEGTVLIEEDEMLIFAMYTGTDMQEKAIEKKHCLPSQKKSKVWFETLELQAFKPNSKLEFSFMRSGFVKTGPTLKLETLLPWRKLNPELEHFSGKGIYSGYIEIEEVMDDCRYILQFGEISDTFTVFVNNKTASFPDQVMKRVEITELIHQGKNELKVIVVSNLYNSLFHNDLSSFGVPVPYVPKNYGIWESEYKKNELLIQVKQDI